MVKTIVAAGALLLAAGVSQAGVIISPVGGTIESGGPGAGSLADTYNQSGLSVGFTSGVTDFDTYLAGGPTHTKSFIGFEWFSEVGAGDATIVTYDLGSVLTIDRLALWNEESSGIGTLELLWSTDGSSFTSFASGLTPTDHLLADYGADVFSFGTVSTRYVRFSITDSPQPNVGSYDAAAIGEVAFRIGNVVPLPPASLLGLGLLGGLGILTRLRKRKSAAIV